MTIRPLAILAALGAAFFMAGCATPTPMRAAPPSAPVSVCGASADIYARLSQAYGETRRAAGLAAAGAALEIWSSPGGATWSLMLTGRGGETCILAVGTRFWIAREGGGV